MEKTSIFHIISEINIPHVLILILTSAFMNVSTLESIDKLHLFFYLTPVTLARHIRWRLDSVSIQSEKCFIMPETLLRRSH